MNDYFKALIDADREPIVICSAEHIIVYMNPTAVKRYEKRGGAELVGKSIFDCHNPRSREIIMSVTESFRENPGLDRVYTYSKTRDGSDSDVYIVALRDEAGNLIGYYEKHESRKRESHSGCDL